jgi:hypothetical protein
MLAVRLLALLAAIAAGPPVRAQTIEAAGRIVDVSPPGSVEIIHRDQTREMASHGVLLRPGDWLDFHREAEVRADVLGRRTTITPGDPKRTIPSRDIGEYGEQDLSFFERFNQFLSKPRMAIPVFPWVRGEPQTGLAPSASAFAPPGRIFVPRGGGQIALVWRAGPAILQIGPAASGSRIESGEHAWALIPLPADPDGLRIGVEGQSLAWTVIVVDRTEGPAWLDPSIEPSEAQRLVRAAWLIEEGPPEWRAFAATELADLAARGSFPAAQLWTAIRSGELERELWP